MFFPEPLLESIGRFISGTDQGGSRLEPLMFVEIILLLNFPYLILDMTAEPIEQGVGCGQVKVGSFCDGSLFAQPFF